MKKIMIILLTILLCACSNSLKWEDVQDKYTEMENSVVNLAEQSEEFLKKDYEVLLKDIDQNLEELQSGVSKDDTAAADTLYETAIKLDKIASLFSNDSSAQLTLLAQGIKDLVILAYGKTDGFIEMRNGIKEKVNEILNWSDEMWAPVEKRALLKWEDVAESYDEFAKEIIANMTKKKEVTEDQLVMLKNDITDNYVKIKDGVTKENEEYAKILYKAGLLLQEYTDKMKGDAAAKVNALATHTIEFVMNGYGVPIEDETYDFFNEAESARKWTLSLWNEVVARLAREDLYDHTR